MNASDICGIPQRLDCKEEQSSYKKRFFFSIKQSKLVWFCHGVDNFVASFLLIEVGSHAKFTFLLKQKEVHKK